MWGALNQWVKMEVDEEKQGAKRPRSTTSNGGKSQGKGTGRKGQVKNQITNGESTPTTNTLLQVLSRLALRHEDTLQCLARRGTSSFFWARAQGPSYLA